MAQPAPDELDRFMAALRQVESSNNYTATNNSETKWGVASGAYQFIDATWNNYKNYPRAMDAPPEIQDEYAKWLLTQYYDKYGDWSLVAVAWHKGPGNADAVLSGEVSVYEIRDKSISTGVYIDRIESASNGLLSSSSAAQATEVRIVPFNQWTVYGKWFPCASYKTKAKGIVVHHSVTKTTNDSFHDARVVEQVIYSRRFTARFSMVAYGYMIHPDGTIFEGRGLTYRNGANNNTKGGSLSNGNTVSVCFIGDYRYREVSQKQIEAFNWLRSDLITRGGVEPSADVHPHSDLSYTACPSFDVKVFNSQLIGEEEPEMMTCLDKVTNEAWVCGNGKARAINDVDQWMKTWEGPIAKVNNMKYVINDLYEVV